MYTHHFRVAGLPVENDEGDRVGAHKWEVVVE